MANKSKNGNTTPEKELIRIDTVAGVVFAHPEEMIEVCISDGIYIPVPAKELTVGSELAYVCEGITNIKNHVSLEDLHIILMDGSPVYHEAHKTLHTEYKEREIPLFQRMLVSSVADLSGDKTLEEKLLSGDNLTRTERTEVLGSLRLLTDDYERPTPYADSTLMGWVQGKVLAPEEWKLFETLSQSYSEFTQFTEEGKGTLHDHWRKYLNRRSGVLTRISRTANAGQGTEKAPKTNDKDNKETDKINLEIGLAYEKFKHLITKGYITVEVKNVKKIKPEPNEREERTKPILQKGIRKKVPEEFGRTLSSQQQRAIFQGLCNELYLAGINHPLITEEDILKSSLVPGALAIILSKELNSPRILEAIHENGIIETLYQRNGNFLSQRLADYLRAKKNPRIHGLEGNRQIPRKVRIRFQKDYEKIMRDQPIITQILKDYESGKLEETLKVPKESFRATINIMRQIYPAFSEDPTQILRYSLGSLLYVVETDRLYQRNLIELLDEKEPIPTLTEALGIPLLATERRRVAYYSIDNLPRSMVLVEYPDLIKPVMRNLEKD